MVLHVSCDLSIVMVQKQTKPWLRFIIYPDQEKSSS